MATINNMTNTETDELVMQCQHMSAENKRLMAENLRYPAAFADIERELPRMNVLVRKCVRAAIARAKGRVQS